MAVGLPGSGINISGDSVSFPLGDDKACWRHARVNWAASEGADKDHVFLGSSTNNGQMAHKQGIKTFILMIKRDLILPGESMVTNTTSRNLTSTMMSRLRKDEEWTPYERTIAYSATHFRN